MPGWLLIKLSPSLNPCSSSFIAELFAILATISRSRVVQSHSITIVTDSKCLIQAITKPYPNNAIIQEIPSKITSSNKNFCMCCVPVDVGIEQNERADALAKACIDIPQSLFTGDCFVPRNDDRSHVKQIINNSWKEECHGSSMSSNKFRDLSVLFRLLLNSSCVNME